MGLEQANAIGTDKGTIKDVPIAAAMNDKLSSLRMHVTKAPGRSAGYDTDEGVVTVGMSGGELRVTVTRPDGNTANDYIIGNGRIRSISNSLVVTQSGEPSAEIPDAPPLTSALLSKLTPENERSFIERTLLHDFQRFATDGKLDALINLPEGKAQLSVLSMGPGDGGKEIAVSLRVEERTSTYLLGDKSVLREDGSSPDNSELTRLRFALEDIKNKVKRGMHE
jgi:hypothetical protein